MEQALSEHVARLRGEVALLRNDLVEQVNGQLRLERTETTRALGSDIEGLQQEIRRLAASREYLTPVPTLTATRETVTVAAAPGDASGAGQRSVPRVVSSPPPASVTGHAGLGDAATGSAAGVPPAGRFDSGPPPGGAMAGPPPRAASPLATPSVPPRPVAQPLATSRPGMPPSAMSRPGLPSSATQRPATPPPAPPRPAASPLASPIPPARAASPPSPLPHHAWTCHRPARRGSAISTPPFTPPPAPPQRVQPAALSDPRRDTGPASQRRLVWRGSVTTWQLCARNRRRPHPVGARRRQVRCRPRLLRCHPRLRGLPPDPRAMACPRRSRMRRRIRSARCRESECSGT
jgi:hypothetical protein